MPCHHPVPRTCALKRKMCTCGPWCLNLPQIILHLPGTSAMAHMTHCPPWLQTAPMGMKCTCDCRWRRRYLLGILHKTHFQPRQHDLRCTQCTRRCPTLLHGPLGTKRFVVCRHKNGHQGMLCKHDLTCASWPRLPIAHRCTQLVRSIRGHYFHAQAWPPTGWLHSLCA